MEQKGGFWTEEDVLGSVQIPEDALYGINTVRAMNNFHLEKRFTMQLYRPVMKFWQSI